MHDHDRNRTGATTPARSDALDNRRRIFRWLETDAVPRHDQAGLSSYLELSASSTSALISLAAPRPSGRDLVLVASWLIIGLVAAYDTYLSVKFQESLPLLEVNPICRWLIAADEGSVAILLGCKFAGTILALGTILLVYLCNRSMGVAVASVVAALQGLVLMYLCLA